MTSPSNKTGIELRKGKSLLQMKRERTLFRNRKSLSQSGPKCLHTNQTRVANTKIHARPLQPSITTPPSPSVPLRVMMAARAESSTAATGKAKAAQDSAASAGYELPWHPPTHPSPLPPKNV